MAPVYLVSFEEIYRVTSEVSTSDQRGLYWETESQFVIEYPVINNAGQSMGFVFRCELSKIGLQALLLRLSPGISGVDLETSIKVFETEFLSRFKKVLGKLGDAR